MKEYFASCADSSLYLAAEAKVRFLCRYRRPYSTSYFTVLKPRIHGAERPFGTFISLKSEQLSVHVIMRPQCQIVASYRYLIRLRAPPTGSHSSALISTSYHRLCSVLAQEDLTNGLYNHLLFSRRGCHAKKLGVHQSRLSRSLSEYGPWLSATVILFPFCRIFSQLDCCCTQPLDVALPRLLGEYEVY